MKYVVKNMLPQPLPLETPDRSLSIGGKNRATLTGKEYHSGRVQELIAARSMKLVEKLEDEKPAKTSLENEPEEVTIGAKEVVLDIEETIGKEDVDLQLLAHNDVQKEEADDCTSKDVGFQEENDGDSLTELPVLPDNKTEEPGRPAKKTKKKGKRGGNHN